MSETILVTGASAGFGRAICRRKVADGHRVIGAADVSRNYRSYKRSLESPFTPFKWM